MLFKTCRRQYRPFLFSFCCFHRYDNSIFKSSVDPLAKITEQLAKRQNFLMAFVLNGQSNFVFRFHPKLLIEFENLIYSGSVYTRFNLYCVAVCNLIQFIPVKFII